MAASYPLSLASFADLLCPEQTTFRLGEALETGQTGAGEEISSSYGPRLWQGMTALYPRRSADMDSIVALCDLLQAAGASFLMTHHKHRYPKADPDGSILDTATPAIASIAGNNRDVTLSGFPAAYVLSAGDLISWTYDTTRRALHRIAFDATADGSGGVTVELTSPVRGSPGTAAVAVIDPLCKAKIIAGSMNTATYDRRWGRGVSFSWKQTLAP